MGTKVSGFGIESDFGKHVSQRAPYAHRTAKFFHIKGAFIDASAGAPDAGKPIKLASDGKIDTSMYVSGANHSLLSATHPDTLAGVVVRGDLVVGNATPKWKRLGLGISGKFLRSDGSDALWASIVAGDLPSHTHVKVDITDTPWAWADVSKTGSNLTDLVTRTHAGLQTVTENQHHNKLHSMTGVQHSASGLTVGHVIRASGATTFVWAQLQHGDLGGVSVDQHHNEIHILVSAKHTASGLTIGHVLTATSPTAFAFQASAGGAAVPHPFLFVGY